MDDNNSRTNKIGKIRQHFMDEESNKFQSKFVGSFMDQ